MSDMNWFDVVPSIMSAVASVGAAFAAFGSLRVSREAKSVAEQSALAIHHSGAAIALTSAVEKLKECTEAFSELAYRTWIEWPSEIEALDHRQAGGTNPRPLRHVLTDASEMLVKHGVRRGAKYRHTAQSMFSIVRDGIVNLNDAEYEKLLRCADGEYCDFEGVFGAPSKNKSINTSPAFRWACYQLIKRIDKENWCEIWEKAWQDKGRLNNFRAEHLKIKPILESILISVKSEKAKLGHSVFPLGSNPSLSLKYDDFFGVVEVLLKDCGLDLVEGHAEHPHKDDVIQLIVYSIGTAFLAMEALESVHGNLDKL